MKRSRLKRITNAEKKHQKILYIQQLIGMAFLGFLAGTILTVSLFNAGHRIEVPTPSGVVKTVEVKADEPDCDSTPLVYLRCRGQQLG